MITHALSILMLAIALTLLWRLLSDMNHPRNP